MIPAVACIPVNKELKVNLKQTKQNNSKKNHMGKEIEQIL